MRAQGHSYTKNVEHGTFPQSRKLCDPLKNGRAGPNYSALPILYDFPGGPLNRVKIQQVIFFSFQNPLRLKLGQLGR